MNVYLLVIALVICGATAILFIRSNRKKTSPTPSEITEILYSTECGHYSPQKIILQKSSETFSIVMAIHESKKVDWCQACLEEMIHICPACKKPIWLGTYVSTGRPIVNGENSTNSEYFLDSDSSIDPARHGYIYHSECVLNKKSSQFNYMDFQNIQGKYDLPGVVNHIMFTPEGQMFYQYKSVGKTCVLSDEFIPFNGTLC